MDVYNKYYEGVFWLPSNEENKIIGTLFIDENGVSTISTLQSLCIQKDDPFTDRFPKFNVVYGWINKNENSETFSIKLYDTKQNHQGLGYLNKFKYISLNSYISKGGDENINAEDYNILMLNSSQINKWVKITGFKVDTNLNEKFEVNQVYKIPDPIELFKNDDLKIYVHFRSNSTYSSFLNRKSIIKEDVFINIETSKNYSIREIINFKNEIEWFFNLFLNQTLCFENIEIRSLSNKDYKSIYKSDKLINQLKGEVDFDLVLRNSQEILEKWFSKKSKLELSFKNFFSVYGQKGVMVENRFITYLSVIENFHRNNIVFEKTSFIVKKYFNKVKFNKFRGVEYPNFRQRLLCILYESKYISNIDDLKVYTQILTDTRDYHVHLLDSKEEKSMTWKEIIESNKLLEIVIRELFLREIGVTEFKENKRNIPEIKVEEIKLNRL